MACDTLLGYIVLLQKGILRFTLFTLFKGTNEVIINSVLTFLDEEQTHRVIAHCFTAPGLENANDEDEKGDFLN